MDASVVGSPFFAVIWVTAVSLAAAAKFLASESALSSAAPCAADALNSSASETVSSLRA
ncbi:MAG: hypothetical protein LBB40_00400 [Holophagales bacterium]|jgi:hypothetical protein|nr:hypothetical protein [Holophagales bacterium]